MSNLGAEESCMWLMGVIKGFLNTDKENEMCYTQEVLKGSLEHMNSSEIGSIHL
jgi:hypothetical protein